MEKLDMHTPNIADKNFEALSKMFPNAVTETIDENGEVVRAIDADVLRQEISCKVVEGKDERYQMIWPDKKKAILLANAISTATLRPKRDESLLFDSSENLYIKGDNLEVLKLLQETYLGKIKMIYIDPPYNTGGDFIYSDDFSEDISEYYLKSGQIDELGNRLVTNGEGNGRFHTDWLNMMYSRLKIARNFLSEDGVILIQIDEGELFNLKKLCDEIFNAGNFVNVISVKTKIAGVSGSFMGKSLQNNTEYILMYCKNPDQFLIENMPKKRQELMDYIQTYADEGKSWKYTSVLRGVDDGVFVKAIQAGNGDEIRIYKHNEYEVKSINKIAEDEYDGDVKKAYYENINNVFRTTNAQTSIRSRVMEESKDIDSDLISIEYVPMKGKNAGAVTKIYYKDANRNMVTYLREVVSCEADGIYKLDNAGNLWDDINYNNLLNEAGISFPNGQKPIQLIKRIIKMIGDKDGIYMDFFSGSASTAHAVMSMNEEDEGKRKYIMIQIPEELPEKSDLRKQGYKTICDIGIKRLSIANEKMTNGGMGYRVLELDSSNMKEVYYNPVDTEQTLLDIFADNIKEDRTPEDLLFQVMLDLGVLLSSKIEETEIAGKKVFNVADGFLIACFDKDVTDETIKAVANMKPYYAVFRDNSMANDSVATNFDQIFVNISPDTIRKVL